MLDFSKPNNRGRGRIPILRRGTRRSMGQQRRLPTQTTPSNQTPSPSSYKPNPEAPIFVFRLSIPEQPQEETQTETKLNPRASTFVPSFNFGSPSSSENRSETVSENDSSSSDSEASETSERSDFSADDDDEDKNDDGDERQSLYDRRDYSTGRLAGGTAKYSIAELLEIRESVNGDVPVISVTNLLCNPSIVGQAIAAALEMRPHNVERFGFAGKGRRPPFQPYRHKQPPTLSEMSQNSFPEQQRRRVSASELEKLMRKTKGILNKIVPKEGESFDRLSQRLCDLIKEHVHSNEEMEVVLDAVVSVAAHQPKFARRYVELLSSLSSKEEIVQSWESAHADVMKPQQDEPEPNAGKVVKRTVRSLCHRYHDEYWFATNQDQHAQVVQECAERLGVVVNDDVCAMIAEFAVPSEDDDESAPARRNLFGLETLIGELCLGNLLPRTLVLCKVMQPLLHVDDESESSLPISPIELEAACTLMSVVGPRFESSSRSRDCIDEYIGRMKNSSQSMPSRMKFMVMDLSDLRKTWTKMRERQKRVEVSKKPSFRSTGHEGGHYNSSRRQQRQPRFSGRGRSRRPRFRYVAC